MNLLCQSSNQNEGLEMSVSYFPSPSRWREVVIGTKDLPNVEFARTCNLVQLSDYFILKSAKCIFLSRDQVLNKKDGYCTMSRTDQITCFSYIKLAFWVHTHSGKSLIFDPQTDEVVIFVNSSVNVWNLFMISQFRSTDTSVSSKTCGFDNGLTILTWSFCRDDENQSVYYLFKWEHVNCFWTNQKEFARNNSNSHLDCDHI